MNPTKSILFSLTLLLSLSGVFCHHEAGHVGGYSIGEIWAYGIVASFGISMLGVIISGIMIIVLRSKRPSSRGIKLTVMTLIAFAVGALLGDAIVHIIPQIYRARTHDVATVETAETETAHRMLHNGVDHGSGEEHEPEEETPTETETEVAEAEPTPSITSLFILVGFGVFIVITKFFDWVGAPHTYWVNEKGIKGQQDKYAKSSTTELTEANKMLGRANSDTQPLDHDGKAVVHATVQVSGNQYSAVAQNESQADWIQKGDSSFLKTVFTSKGRKASGFTILLALFFHNIVDGLAIGGTFSTGNKDIAITTFIAVLAHQIPRGMGDMGILLEAKFPIAQALLWRSLLNFITIAGAAIGLGIGLINEVANAYLLGFVTGTFLYLSLVSMMPHLNADSKGVKSLLFLGAFIVGAGFPFALLTVE